MEFQHELIIPNEGFPFKVFLFEGGNGNYVREKHWHTSVEIFAVMEGRLDFFVNKDEYPLKAVFSVKPERKTRGRLFKKRGFR